MLVATTVIEVGVDVPNATIMIVQEADRFGLAQLHQLRGRVGRGGGAVVLPARLAAGRGADRRRAASGCEALVDTTDGFELAEEDLELRGEGQLLGTRQSGLLATCASRTCAPTARCSSGRGRCACTGMRRLADEVEAPSAATEPLPERASDAPLLRPRTPVSDTALRRGMRAKGAALVPQAARMDGCGSSPAAARATASRRRRALDTRRPATACARPSSTSIGPVDGRGRARPLRRLGRDGPRGALARRRARASSSSPTRDACRAINANLDQLRLTGAQVALPGRRRASSRQEQRGTLRPRLLRPALRRARPTSQPTLARARCRALLADGRAARPRDLGARDRARARRSRAHELAPLRLRAPDALRAPLMVTAICPGSYDPVTNGHVDVIRARPRSSTASSSASSATRTTSARCSRSRSASQFLARGARRARQRRGRRLLRARRRLRPPLGRDGDGQGPARDLGLRVGVPDEPPEPDARARDRDRLRDGEPAVQLRLVERREGDRDASAATWTSSSRRRSRAASAELFPDGRPGAPVSPQE